MDVETVGGVPGILIFLLGMAAGGVLAYLFLPSRKGQRLEAQIEEQARAHDRYRTEVTEHFGKTAELVNAMTQSYKAVYQHLAQGAQTLCQDEASNPALQFSEPRLIGEQSTAPAPAAASERTPAPVAPGAPRAATEPPPAAPADHAEEPPEPKAAAEPAPPQAPKDYAPEAEPSR